MLHHQPAEPVALEPRAHNDGEFADLVARIVVQPHHAEHAAGRFLDRNRGHRMIGIVMDELVDHFGADFAHRREMAQPKIVGLHLAHVIRVKRGVLGF